MKYFYFLCSFVLFSVFFNTIYAIQGTVIACNQQYALCTSAQCIPDPRNPKYAICNCLSYHGNSLGYTSCKSRKPFIEQNKTLRITSTFSLEGLQNKLAMQCQKGAWTNCLDQPCNVNPLNPKYAICSCPIVTTSTFVTFGGNCNMATCTTGFWSAAFVSQSNALLSTLKKTSMPNLLTTKLMCPVK